MAHGSNFVAAGLAHRQRPPRVFYGWFVVLGGFAVTFLGFGTAYTFSVFMGALQHDFAASRGSISLVFSLAGFLYFSLGLLSGPLAERWGAKRLAAAGMLLIALGLVAAGFARTLLQVYVAYGLGVGLGAGLSYVPAVGAVQRWFTRRRALASGLAVSGIGVGTVVMPAVAAALIGAFGWRDAYWGLGGLVAVTGLSLSLLIEDDPYRRHLAPDGDPVARTPQPPAEKPSLWAVVRTPKFISLYLACLSCSLGAFVPFVHLVPYAEGHGVPEARAVLLLGLIGVGSTAGRFFLGGIADRLGRGPSLLAMFIGMGVSLAIWAVATNFWSLSAFAVLYGIFYGGWVAVLPAVVADYFGARNASGVIGALYTSAALGTLIGPAAAGYVFDVTHTYLVPISASAAANLVAAAIIAATLKASRAGAASR